MYNICTNFICRSSHIRPCINETMGNFWTTLLSRRVVLYKDKCLVRNLWQGVRALVMLFIARDERFLFPKILTTRDELMQNN